ncbi:efflux RND transporter periplasmic adaptor subunit [Candidatus Latescibacterota bacterium]
MKKIALKGIAVLFILFLLWRVVALIRGSEEASRQRVSPPVAVEVEKVAYEPIRDIREFTGTIDPLYRYIIAPKISGRIIEMKKRIGDSVTKGEVIVRIDDAEYKQAEIEAEANLKIAEASLAETESQLELSQQELIRVQSLQEKGIASPSEFDAIQTNFAAQQSRLKLAQAQVEQREAALKSAQIRLGYSVLTAPEPGFIGERFVDEGTLLAPNTPVVSVIGIDRIIVKTTVIERDYGLLQLGQSAEVIVDGFPGERFSGNVSQIAPLLQESSRVAQMEIAVNNDSHKLKPGMFANIRVVIEENSNAQVILGTALVRRNGNSGVFIVREGELLAHFLIVNTGIETQEKVEVLDPKLDGMVVTLGHHLLEDGGAVLLP